MLQQQQQQQQQQQPNDGILPKYRGRISATYNYNNNRDTTCSLE